MVATELIVAWWEFVIPQNDFFSLIRFLSLEFQFRFAMAHFCCFRFVLMQVSQWMYFYRYYSYDGRLKLSF